MITYSSTLAAYASNAVWDRALKLLMAMKPSISPELVCFSSTMAACQRAGRWPLPLALAQRMETQEMSPNLVISNNLISACAQDAQWLLALHLFTNSKITDVIGRWSCGGLLCQVTSAQVVSRDLCPRIPEMHWTSGLEPRPGFSHACLCGAESMEGSLPIDGRGM